MAEVGAKRHEMLALQKIKKEAKKEAKKKQQSANTWIQKRR